MKHKLILAVVLGISNFAMAMDYPVLDSFASLAHQLAEATKVAQSQSDLDQIQAHSRDLLNMGIEINHLLGQKKQICQPQYDSLLAAIPSMEKLSPADVHAKYHDGAALPEAPKLCYYGRSVIVHPIMNMIRLRSNFSEQSRNETVEDFDEIVGHIGTIKMILNQ